MAHKDILQNYQTTDSISHVALADSSSCLAVRCLEQCRSCLADGTEPQELHSLLADTMPCHRCVRVALQAKLKRLCSMRFSPLSGKN